MTAFDSTHGTPQVAPPTGYYTTDADPHFPDLPHRIDSLNDVRRYIDAIDFAQMRAKMASHDHGGLGWSQHRLDYTERLYKNWLFLRRKYEGEQMPPSEDIDVFWHWHILDTHAYHRDTAAIFGYYLHHFPYFGIRGEDDYAELLNAWSNTQHRYLEEYGDEIYEYDDDEDEAETG